MSNQQPFISAPFIRQTNFYSRLDRLVE